MKRYNYLIPSEQWWRKVKMAAAANGVSIQAMVTEGLDKIVKDTFKDEGKEEER